MLKFRPGHHHLHTKILFLLKHRRAYSQPTDMSSGLLNSIALINDMINSNFFNVTSKYTSVVDNNDIDRIVTRTKPDIVVIEALWVVPEKFDILKKLHPNVKWIVRIHSNIDFLAGEGIAFEWIYKYLQKGITVACNSIETAFALSAFSVASGCYTHDGIIYLPNYYPIDQTNFKDISHEKLSHKQTIDIGCFGAVRILKNQMNQALAAIMLSNETGLNINFHMNSTRIEGMYADPVLKNLINVFENVDKCKLVLHEWLEHDSFLLLTSAMDINLQVSFTETFNIVSADSVAEGVPVVSFNVPWLKDDGLEVTDVNASTIKDKLIKVIEMSPRLRIEVIRNQKNKLMKFSDASLKIWSKFFRDM